MGARVSERGSGTAMKVKRLDHIVLTVQDIERTLHWYHTVFGMDIVVMADGRKALQFGADGAQQRIHLHRTGHEIEPHAKRPTLGAADLCLVANLPMGRLLDELRRDGVDMAGEGIVRREGALGPTESVYVRDPDGNLIEIADYPHDLPNEPFERYS